MRKLGAALVTMMMTAGLAFAAGDAEKPPFTGRRSGSGGATPGRFRCGHAVAAGHVERAVDRALAGAFRQAPYR